MILLLVVALLVCAAFGAPLFCVLFLGASIAYPTAGLNTATDFFQDITTLMDQPYLLPIPLFTFAGYLMARSQTPMRLVNAAEGFFGWIPGGIAIVSVATCAFFTTFTGASGVTIIALGGILYPVLLQKKYPKQFSLGLMTSSGSIGLLFFPALPVFLFATVYSLSTNGKSALDPGELFLGGLFPGLLMVGLLCLYCLYIGVRFKIPRVRFEKKKAFRAIREAWGELLLPFLILGLLQTGSVGINELAAITAAYIFFLEVVVHREIGIRDKLPEVIRESMILVGAIVVILAVVVGFNNYLKDAEVPQAILATMKTFIDNKFLFLLVINIFLLIVGCLMDIFSAIVAIVPLIVPLALEFGIDPVHLGVIFLANLEIGYLTPPVGMNLFIASYQFDRPMMEVYKSVVPFIAILAIALLTITYVPALSTWLPETLGQRSEAVNLDEDEEGNAALEALDAMDDDLDDDESDEWGDLEEGGLEEGDDKEKVENDEWGDLEGGNDEDEPKVENDEWGDLEGGDEESPEDDSGDEWGALEGGD
jgi:C4-dicarboxylate transporter DctM subunit